MRPILRFALLIVTLAAAPFSANAAALVAEKITAANAAQHVQTGLDATGGVGGYAYGPEIKAELLKREGAGEKELF